MNINKAHQRIEKERVEELKKLNDETNDKFLRFQLENGVRAQVLHPYLNNYIVAKVMEEALLTWRPMEDDEKNSFQEKIAKDAGIEIPRK